MQIRSPCSPAPGCRRTPHRTGSPRSRHGRPTLPPTATATPAFWDRSAELLAELPPKRQRNAAEAETAALVLGRARETRDRFLAVHAEAVYDEVTAARPARGWRIWSSPSPPRCRGSPRRRRRSRPRPRVNQADKDGVEIDQGILLAHVLAVPGPGPASATPCCCRGLKAPSSSPASPPTACSTSVPCDSNASGRAVHLTAGNPRFLNAEDDTTLDRMEAAVDVAILDAGERDRRRARRPASTIPSTRAAGCSAPASTSPTSTAARSRSSGSCGGTSATSTSCCAASRGPRSLPDDMQRAQHREAVDRGGRRPSPSAATASFSWSPTMCSPPTTPS